MHTTIVTMRSGKMYEGPIWEFRPREGYLTLAGVEDESTLFEGELLKLYFRDMASAVTPHERVSVTQPDVEVDELDRARKGGWDGS